MRTLSVALFVTLVGCGAGQAPVGTLVGTLGSSGKADGISGGYQLYGLPGGGQAVALDATGTPTTRFTWTMDDQQNTTILAEDLTSGDQTSATIDAQGNTTTSSGSLSTAAQARFAAMQADLAGASAGGKSDDANASCVVGTVATATGCVLGDALLLFGGFTAAATIPFSVACGGLVGAEIATCKW